MIVGIEAGRVNMSHIIKHSGCYNKETCPEAPWNHEIVFNQRNKESDL